MADTYTINADGTRAPDAALVTYTHIIYALHALSVLIGVTGPATVIGSFIFGLPSIIAVIMNYVRRSEARGTWLESHFTWQLRTFWFAVLWVVLVAVALLRLTQQAETAQIILAVAAGVAIMSAAV